MHFFTTGKNTPTPLTGTRKRRVKHAANIVSGYLALLVTGCIDIGGETCSYSVQVGSGYVSAQVLHTFLFSCVFVKMVFFIDSTISSACGSSTSSSSHATQNPLGGNCNPWCQGWGVKPNCKRCLYIYLIRIYARGTKYGNNNFNFYVFFRLCVIL